MKFRTEIHITEPPFRIHHRDKITVLGSCFAVHMGEWLRRHWWNVDVNPFGNVYNPVSWLELLERSFEERPPQDDEVFVHNDQWKSLLLPSRFNTLEKAEYLRQAARLFRQVRRRLQQTDVLILTYGTAQVFRHTATGKVVVNCNKIPSELCRRDMLSIEQMNQAIGRSIDLLRKLNPEVRIILTLSPVRYLHDGLTANARSKARLLESILQQTEQYENVIYFPAYEIFMDDLRDYRFYGPDLKQPGEQGINYTIEKFSEAFFSDETSQLCKRIAKLRAGILHRSIVQNPENHHQKIRDEITKLLNRHPFLKPDIEI